MVTFGINWGFENGMAICFVFKYWMAFYIIHHDHAQYIGPFPYRVVLVRRANCA